MTEQIELPYYRLHLPVSVSPSPFSLQEQYCQSHVQTRQACSIRHFLWQSKFFLVVFLSLHILSIWKRQYRNTHYVSHFSKKDDVYPLISQKGKHANCLARNVQLNPNHDYTLDISYSAVLFFQFLDDEISESIIIKFLV